ncbi:DNA ligase 6 [Ananas comosus]|uniref:DNA ligase n=1 Tax=Ananas comosus TaxID=4615 RepID=A0A6P5FT47_ANACO|nr:DNA ligase 6 [Ananas comosus]
MAALPLPTPKALTLTITTSSLFLSSLSSFSAISPQTRPPLSFDLLSHGSPLPPIPSTFPRHKLIPNSRFVVDGFRSAGDFSVSYFLSHFHSDHYAGLNPSWCEGIIFCSEVTARLLKEILRVPHFFVVPLALGETVGIDGWDVTLVDANHCPGAVQFLFKGPRGWDGQRNANPARYVHTGDFRFCESMKSDSNLREFVGSDAVFLDTTYCNPKFVFPSQEESVEYVVRTIRRIRDQNKGSSESILFLIATYVVGKEKILLEISRQCDCLLHVDSRKMAILSVLGFGETGVFTEDASASHIHVIGWNLLGETWPYFRPNFVKMKEIMIERGYSRVVGFVSTGWMYETKRDGFAVRVKDSLEIHLVPYSEHSNYDELREYVRYLRPKRVIPTVGVDVEKFDGKYSIALRKHFAGLVDEMANKHEFLGAFHQKLGVATQSAENDVACSSNQQAEEEARNSAPLVSVSLGKDSDLDGLNCLNDMEVEGARKELRDFLPSWVTEEQVLDLLKYSDGDIVKAVSVFFECERDLYEEASSCSVSIPSSQKSMPTDLDTVVAKVTEEGPKYSPKKSLVHVMKPVNRNSTISSSNLPKKRSSGSGNRPKKKGKSVVTVESSGSKQSTITKFFGRVAPTVSCNDSSANINGDRHQNIGDRQGSDTVEMHMQEVDQFLQIIDGGMAREAALSLLEKAKGDINRAVDMYYRNHSDVCSGERNTVPCSTTVDIYASPNNCNEKSSNSKAKATFSNLYIKGCLTGDTAVANVSLPIEKYLPVDHACWKAGQPAPFLHLARTFDLVEQEKGKIKTNAMLCNMFRSLLALSPDDVLPAVYLCTNRIAADHENMELNIGGGLVITALQETFGTNRARIKEMYKTSGDLGDVAQECRQNQSVLAPPRSLSISHVISVLRRISLTTGSGSAGRRKTLVIDLMRSCREMELKFLVRALVRNLRIGATMRTILPALAHAVVLHSCSPSEPVFISEALKTQMQGISAEVAHAYNVLPNLDLLIPSLLSKGITFSASTLAMVPGTPIPPMLSRITNGFVEVLKLFQGRAFTCEYKYDGQRAQIHRLPDGSIRVFSRQMKESTSRFPDLISVIRESCNPTVQTFIADAEVVAIDRNGSKLMSFQELSSRERGSKDSSVLLHNIKVDICVFIFDIMLYNGERLLDYPLRERRKYINNLFQEKMGYLELAKETTVEADEAFPDNQDTLHKISTFFEEACSSFCEGIMVKTLDCNAGYFASKRSEAWLKVKRDYVEGFGDTLDLVPIGAWHGNGRKAGWYSPFLMACYNPETEEFQSVCRVMTGFSDSFYKEMKEYFSGEKILAKKPPYYQTDEVPDFWFASELVWEIRGADLTVSPVHHAAVGLVHPSRGISVRLPRFVRSVPDRKPEDCSSAVDIVSMFKSQTRKMEVN